MPFPYAIREWLWALFAGLISSLLSSFVVLPGLIALDEERQARHWLEILFCCTPKTMQSELQSQNPSRSSQGYEFFYNKVGNVLLGRMSGKAIFVIGLALCGAVGWFYNTSRLEMDFNVPWPTMAQELLPSRWVGALKFYSDSTWCHLYNSAPVDYDQKSIVNCTLRVTGPTACFSLIDQTI